VADRQALLIVERVEGFAAGGGNRWHQDIGKLYVNTAIPYRQP
jgi:hypothetical protein